MKDIKNKEVKNYIHQLCNTMKESFEQSLIDFCSGKILNKEKEKIKIQNEIQNKINKTIKNVFKDQKYLYLVEKVTTIISNWTEQSDKEIVGVFKDVNEADKLVQKLYAQNIQINNNLIEYRITQIPYKE